MSKLERLLAIQRRLKPGQTESYRSVTKSQITEELRRFALVSAHQPFPERRMEEHVRVVEALHEESREHL